MQILSIFKLLSFMGFITEKNFQGQNSHIYKWKKVRLCQNYDSLKLWKIVGIAVFIHNKNAFISNNVVRSSSTQKFPILITLSTGAPGEVEIPRYLECNLITLV